MNDRYIFNQKERTSICIQSGGHGPDEFLLKLRSRENKIVEIQLAIYGTTDWHRQRMKILSKIEEVSFLFFLR